MNTEVHVWSRMQAAELTVIPNEVFISIWSPLVTGVFEGPLALDDWLDVLSLGFWDMDENEASKNEMKHLFNDNKARAIIEFAEEHRDRTIHVHCDAGFSRSVAVGRFLQVFQDRRLVLHATETDEMANSLVLRKLNRILWEKA